MHVFWWHSRAWHEMMRRKKNNAANMIFSDYFGEWTHSSLGFVAVQSARTDDTLSKKSGIKIFVFESWRKFGPKQPLYFINYMPPKRTGVFHALAESLGIGKLFIFGVFGTAHLLSQNARCSRVYVYYTETPRCHVPSRSPADRARHCLAHNGAVSHSHNIAAASGWLANASQTHTQPHSPNARLHPSAWIL